LIASATISIRGEVIASIGKRSRYRRDASSGGERLLLPELARELVVEHHAWREAKAAHLPRGINPR
jgi:hypothetical protein